MEMYEARYKWAQARKFAALPSVVSVCTVGEGGRVRERAREKRRRRRRRFY